MSVVLCIGLADGVLLASDCRGTWTFPDGSKRHSDDLQKVFAIAPGTAIGFVGDVRAAGYLLSALFAQLPTREHQDPISLRAWLPRLFRKVYERHSQKRGESPGVTFVVPYVLGDRATVIRRVEFGKLFDQYLKNMQGPFRGPSPFVWGLVKAFEKKDVKEVSIRDFPYSTFYTMRPRNFYPELAPTLTSIAIGSGEKILDDDNQFSTPIQLYPDKPGVEMADLEMALWSVAHSFGEPTVGGMFPILKVKSDHTEFRAVGQRFFSGTPHEAAIELVVENDRFIQRNRTTEREVPLRYPWEVGSKPSSKRFDDFDDAWRKIWGAGNKPPKGT